MQENDMELKLLHGSPIEIEKVATFHPLKLHEIKDIGEIKYNKMIYVISLNKKMFNIEDEISQFELTFLYCRQDESFRELFLSSMLTFTKEVLSIFDENNSCFFYFGSLEEKRFVGIKEFDEIVQIIKRQNFINEKEKEEEKATFYDEESKKIYDQLQQFKQKVKESNQENGLNLSDIISIVSNHSLNINMFNVWDLTVYQLYTAYLRLMLKDNYESNYYLLPHVSDSKTLDLKHWATKISK